jgi:cell wall-associated NlpC family hydrolase
MKLIVLARIILITLLLTACSSSPERSDHGYTPAQYARAIAIAQAQIGKPYRYGGSAPSKGFDCSGLVYYSYRKAGISVPRDSKSQLRSVNRVSEDELRPGDLLFYRIDGNPNHVTIYIGKGNFVHAPSSGKKVTTGAMNDPYWKKRLHSIGQVVH